MTRVLVATRSRGKVRELAPLLGAAGFVPIDLATAGVAATPNEDAIESHETFEANAMAKARHFYAISGLPTLADDSGLCVDALGGGPGVRSKRWSGQLALEGDALDAANNAHLLAELHVMGADVSRAARYVCAAAWVDDAGELAGWGETRGRILERAHGAWGFGYDPYFFSDELGRAFGEVSVELKQTVSHRARAVRALLDGLRSRR